MADAAGGIAYSGVSDAEAAGEIAFQGPTADFILYGVVNGAFEQGPSNPDANIEPVNNPLPYWSGPVHSGDGAITCKWVADATAPSGHVVECTIHENGISELYFEQIIPIGGSLARQVGHLVRLAAYRPTAPSSLGTISLRYLDFEENELGAEQAAFETLSDATPRIIRAYAQGGFAPPSDAYYLRIRIGVEGSLSAGSVVRLADVRVDPARSQLLLVDQVDPATYSLGIIEQDLGRLAVGPRGLTTALYIGSAGYEFSSTVPLLVAEQTAPATPSSGTLAVYADTSGVLRPLNDGGLSQIGVEGVKFPATQVPSADPNTQDDYEEVDWTPVAAYTTVGTSTWAPSVQVGKATKIGNRVFFTFTYTGIPTNGTGAGQIRISGLPYTSDATANNFGQGATSAGGWTLAGYGQVVASVIVNSTSINFLANGSGVGAFVLTTAEIPSGGTVALRCAGHYMAA